MHAFFYSMEFTQTTHVGGSADSLLDGFIQEDKQEKGLVIVISEMHPLLAVLYGKLFVWQPWIQYKKLWK